MSDCVRWLPPKLKQSSIVQSHPRPNTVCNSLPSCHFIDLHDSICHTACCTHTHTNEPSREKMYDTKRVRDWYVCPYAANCYHSIPRDVSGMPKMAGGEDSRDQDREEIVRVESRGIGSGTASKRAGSADGCRSLSECQWMAARWDGSREKNVPSEKGRDQEAENGSR